jgi:hypothetical protein
MLALAAAGGLALSLVPASAALAGSAFDEVLKDYQKDGQIDPCAHSEKTLRDAQNQIPNDIEQYAPDFPDALRAALRARAAGACDKKGGGGASTTTPAGGSGGGGSNAPPAAKPKPGQPPTPPPVAKPTGGELASSVQHSASASTASTPTPIILLAILGAILLAVGLFALVARFMGWGFEGLQPAWHSMREAGWRTENVFSEFADWLRFGR